MKSLFPEYYTPSKDEFRELWETCLFAFDANVLLNIYGYSETTRTEFLALLERLSSRIHEPFQFALEYQRNRHRAIMEQVKNYAVCESALKDVYDKHLIPKTKHPFLNEDLLVQYQHIQNALLESRKAHEKLFSDDPYFAKITVILSNITVRPTNLEKLHQAGKERYSRQVPPGFADEKDKPEPECFGDYIGWTQLIEIAKKESKPVILVTDDAKEDWWQYQGDRTIGPRPDLVAEFRSESGQRFYMYSSDRFVAFAREYLSEQVNEEAIEEIRERSKEQSRNVSELKATSADAQDTAHAEKSTPPFQESPDDDIKATGTSNEASERDSEAKGSS